MPSKPHTDDVYRPKRVPKNPIKFKLQLNDEQKEAKADQWEVVEFPAIFPETDNPLWPEFWSIEELENMIPWEREVYLSMLVQYLKEEKQKQQSLKKICQRSS